MAIDWGVGPHENTTKNSLPLPNVGNDHDRNQKELAGENIKLSNEIFNKFNDYIAAIKISNQNFIVKHSKVLANEFRKSVFEGMVDGAMNAAHKTGNYETINALGDTMEDVANNLEGLLNKQEEANELFQKESALEQKERIAAGNDRKADLANAEKERAANSKERNLKKRMAAKQAEDEKESRLKKFFLGERHADALARQRKEKAESRNGGLFSFFGVGLGGLLRLLVRFAPWLMALTAVFANWEKIINSDSWDAFNNTLKKLVPKLIWLNDEIFTPLLMTLTTKILPDIAKNVTEFLGQTVDVVKSVVDIFKANDPAERAKAWNGLYENLFNELERNFFKDIGTYFKGELTDEGKERIKETLFGTKEQRAQIKSLMDYVPFEEFQRDVGKAITEDWEKTKEDFRQLAKSLWTFIPFQDFQKEMAQAATDDWNRTKTDFHNLKEWFWSFNPSEDFASLVETGKAAAKEDWAKTKSDFKKAKDWFFSWLPEKTLLTDNEEEKTKQRAQIDGFKEKLNTWVASLIPDFTYFTSGESDKDLTANVEAIKTKFWGVIKSIGASISNALAGLAEYFSNLGDRIANSVKLTFAETMNYPVLSKIYESMVGELPETVITRLDAVNDTAQKTANVEPSPVQSLPMNTTPERSFSPAKIQEIVERKPFSEKTDKLKQESMMNDKNSKAQPVIIAPQNTTVNSSSNVSHGTVIQSAVRSTNNRSIFENSTMFGAP